MTADTLDNQLASIALIDVDYIKLDVQGHELAILKGAEKALEHAIGIESEVEFLALYEGQPLFHDVNAFLLEKGFELYDIKRTFRNRHSCVEYTCNKGQLLWADALYFRSPENIMSQSDITADKVLRAAKVYLSYNYPELVNKLLALSQENEKLPVSLQLSLAESLKGRKHTSLSPTRSFRGKGLLSKIAKKIACLLHTNWGSDKNEDLELGNI